MKKKGERVRVNLGSGVGLLGDGFINVDKFFTLKDLKEGVRTKKGMYANAVIPKGAKFKQGDLLDLPLPDNFADYIEMLDVIEHIAILDVVTALSEIRRILKPGGLLTMITNDFSYLAHEWLKFEAKDNLDLDHYAHIASVTYGNQFGAGEFHRVPFSPRVMKFYMERAGWDVNDTEKVKITLHLKGEVYPSLEGRTYPETVYYANDAIRVDARK